MFEINKFLEDEKNRTSEKSRPCYHVVDGSNFTERFMITFEACLFLSDIFDHESFQKSVTYVGVSSDDCLFL